MPLIPNQTSINQQSGRKNPAVSFRRRLPARPPFRSPKNLRLRIHAGRELRMVNARIECASVGCKINPVAAWRTWLAVITSGPSGNPPPQQ